MNIEYKQLNPGSGLPDISGMKPFLAVLVIEDRAEPEWRDTVSKWLVKSGCKYMMAWGTDHTAWDESVDLANLAQFEGGEIPEDELVLATQHGDGSLEQFFAEAKTTAIQDCADFYHTLILHISWENREDEFKSLYSQA